MSLLAVLLAACALVACSAAPPAPAAPEHPHLRLGVLPIVDDAHLMRAQAAGYFAAEGLTVELVTVQGGAAALPRLVTGDLDLTFTNYVSALLGQAQGKGTFRFVDGGYQAGPNTLLIMTKPGSAIRSPRDLAGQEDRRQHAAEHRRADGALGAGDRGRRPGLGHVRRGAVPRHGRRAAERPGRRGVHRGALQHPGGAGVRGGQRARRRIGRHRGHPDRRGRDHGGASPPKNPRTVAAFRRAVARAQADMADRSVVEQILPTYTKITPDTAALIALGSWPATLDGVRLQRDVDLMRQYGVLTADLDVRSMVL